VILLDRTALRLLEEQEQEPLARLRGEIQKGLDSGPATPLDMDEIKRLGRKRIQEVSGTSASPYAGNRHRPGQG